MNITNPDESLDAWVRDTKSVLIDSSVPEFDRERVLYETDYEHALIYDVVSAYYESRFYRTF